MTSRNSFFNLLKEDFRRRLWTVILSSLVFFATFVVAFTMVLQNLVSNYSRASLNYTSEMLVERVSSRLCQDFYGVYPWFMLVAVVGAVICGMSGFAYLHSRKQMDFYHSLPIKRETIFAVRFVNGIMIYAIPYLVGLLFTYILCAVYGVMTSDIFFASLYFFVVHLMGYLIVYLGTIIAMLLTGKMVIAFFGNCVLNLYAPAVYMLVIGLRELFLVTSYGNYVDMENALLVTRWLSPLSYYFSLITALEEGKSFGLEFLFFLLFAAVLVVLAVWLYKKRASEKADTAMSFKVTEPVVRVMLAIPVGILTGILFFSIQYDYGYSIALFWLIFGGLLGGFLAHGIIEALYNGDIKKCLSHKVQMLVTMVLAAVVPLVFLFDIFGFDSYLPKKEDIKSMAVSSSELRFGGSYYDEDGWERAEKYVLENMEVTNIDAMYELAEVLTAAVAESREDRFFGYGVYDVYYDELGKEKNYATHFVIRYTLKNGSEVIRRYEYNYYAVLDILERIYNDDDFKKMSHPVFSLLEVDYKPLYVECYAPATGITVKLEKNCELIMQTYAEEMLAMNFKDLKETAAIGELIMHFIVQGENEYTDSTTFLVYPSMTRTIALLKEQGYNMQGIQDTVSSGSVGTTVTNVTVRYSGTINMLKELLGMEVESVEGVEEYDVEMYENSYEFYEKYGDLAVPITAEAYHEIELVFTDPAEIEELKKSLVYSSYTSEFGPFPERIGYFSAEVYFEASAGPAYTEGLLGWTENYRFVEDNIPQFVIDRAFEEMNATVE